MQTITKKIVKTDKSKALNVLLTFVLIVTLMPTTLLLSGRDQAYADDAVSLEIGGSIPYAGYSTNWMYADGSMAYCADPALPTPSAGTYTKEAIYTDTTYYDRSMELELTLWYAYGSPGFDPSIWPSKWYDGSDMDAGKYVACAHILLCDAFTSDGTQAYYGTSAAFKRWVLTDVIGIDGATGERFPNATGRIINAKVFEQGERIPSNFQPYILYTGSRSQHIISFTYVPNGSVELTKVSADTSMTDGNGNYSVQGAVYGIYNDAACTDLVSTMTTDVNGYAKSENVSSGEKYVREITASQGYEVDTAVYTVTVAAGETVAVNEGQVPEQPSTGAVKLVKVSANPDITDGNDCYSLSGAVYGIYKDAACTVLETTMTTGEDGMATAEGVSLGLKYVKEITAPNGYALDTNVYPVVLRANETTTLNVSDKPQNDPAGILLGKYDGENTYNGEGNLPQGSASLAGAEYTVRYYDGLYDTAEEAEASGDPTRTWVLRTDSDGYAYLGDAYKISGDPLYYDSFGVASIPIGTILIQETKAPAGYLLDSNTVYIRQITQEGNVENVNSYNIPQVPEQIARGDLSFVKVRDSNQSRMGNIPFRITSLTTGESHIVVSDPNGNVSTAASWNSHTDKTNANDAAVAEDGTVDVSKLDYTAGVWFGDKDKADNSRGALPFDNYSIEELRVYANRNYDLVTIPAVAIYRNDYTVDLGQIENRLTLQKYMTTTARADDTSKLVQPNESVIGIDRVEYMNFDPSENKTYIMKTSLVEGETGDPVLNKDGQPVTAETEFTPAEANGIVEVQVTFDAREHAGKSVVFFEEVVDKATGEVVLEHKDLNDFAQSLLVTAPSFYVNTAARAEDGGKILIADPAARAIDRVNYTVNTPNPDRVYILTTTLMDKATGEALLDAEGNELVATKEFTTPNGTGYVENEIVFDSRELSGHEIVFFEEITDKATGLVVGEHKDINDFEQTLKIATPEIGTVAHDAVSATKNVPSTGNASIKDTVAYSNLALGKEYTLVGALMITDAEGNVIPFEDAEGNVITNSVKFTPESNSGKIDVVFNYMAGGYEGDIVVYEQLLMDENVIATHEDITDADQTVTAVAVSVSSLALNAYTQGKTVLADAEAKINDTISLEDAAIGKTYGIHAILVDSETGLPILSYVEDETDEDAEQAQEQAEAFMRDLLRVCGLEYQGDIKALLDVEPAYPTVFDEAGFAALLDKYPTIADRLVIANASHVAKNQNGVVELQYKLDGRGLEGISATSVCFIDNGEGLVVAGESDLSCANQTIEFVASSIGTTATDATDDDKALLNSTEAQIKDVVTYHDLMAGVEYTIVGTLMDKATGKAVLVNDEPIVVEQKFTPRFANGSVDVLFDFDASALDNHDVVVFEKLYREVESTTDTAEEMPVAVHEDINDEGQTVKITSLAKTPQTGTYGTSNAVPVAVFALASIALMAGVGVYFKKRFE